MTPWFSEAEASHKLCPSHAPLNQLEIFMKMRKWVHGRFVTMISTPLNVQCSCWFGSWHGSPASSWERQAFLQTGLIWFLAGGDNLPPFAADFSKIMTCVFLSQLTTDCCWEAHVHADNWVSFPLITSCYRCWREMQIMQIRCQTYRIETATFPVF